MDAKLRRDMRAGPDGVAAIAAPAPVLTTHGFGRPAAVRHDKPGFRYTSGTG